MVEQNDKIVLEVYLQDSDDIDGCNARMVGLKNCRADLSSGEIIYALSEIIASLYTMVEVTVDKGSENDFEFAEAMKRFNDLVAKHREVSFNANDKDLSDYVPFNFDWDEDDTDDFGGNPPGPEDFTD